MANLNKILEEIKSIDKKNLFLDYIVERVQDDNYRGIHCAQHSRVRYDEFETILSAIYEIVGYERVDIPVGDCERDAIKLRNALSYKQIVDNIKTKINKGSYDAIKKINFPDMARMGFLQRYDREGNLIVESQTFGENKIKHRSPSIYQVQLSEQAKKFLEEQMIFGKRKQYTDGIDKLTKNVSNELLLLLNEDDFDTITDLEFMYIISDDREKIHFSDKRKLLLEYRKLNQEQKQKVTNLLKQYCNPQNWARYNNKILLRDYGNWKNETQTIFHYLGQSAYFQVVNGSLCLNNGNLGLFVHRAKRKQSSKEEYFKQHKIEKCYNYHLHHIIPFSKAITQNDAEWIDDYRNLIYISETKHNEIPIKNNPNIIMSYTDPIINLASQEIRGKIININLSSNDALLNTDLIQIMTKYNGKLLQKFYGIT